MSYSIILPTLNEAGHIVKLIENIIDVFSKIQEKFEIIIVEAENTYIRAIIGAKKPVIAPILFIPPIITTPTIKDINKPVIICNKETL